MAEPTPSPLVSVIVPVYNAEATLPGLIDALRALDHPPDRLEVLLVDNRSTDSSAEIIRGSGFTYLREDRAQSSYAARNLGIERARGEILAFTDADCRPDPRWLAESIGALEAHGADLVGGRVVTRLSDPNNLYELYNVFIEPPQDAFVQRGTAITGNLVTRRRVIDEIGGFCGQMISCGDLLFTQRAKEHGLRLVLAEGAVVYHEPRRTAEALRRKAWRLGFGLVQYSYQRFGRADRGASHRAWNSYLPAIGAYVLFLRWRPLGWRDRLRAFFLFWSIRLQMAAGSRAAVRHQRRGGGELPIHG